MTQEDRVNVRSSAEMLSKGLWFNAYANWGVAIAQLLTVLVQLLTVLVILYVFWSG